MSDTPASPDLLLPASPAVVWSAGGWLAVAVVRGLEHPDALPVPAYAVAGGVAPVAAVDDARAVARRLVWRVSSALQLVVADTSPYENVHVAVPLLSAPAADLVRDNSGDLALRCPHPGCGKVGDIREVNVSDVWSRIRVVADGGEAHLRIDSPCGDDGFEGDGWLCAACAQPVDLPDEVNPADIVYV